MIKLSIVTINLNDKKGLQDTFKSVFSQSFKDFEYIVIDGNSTDGSADLIRENQMYLSYWESEADRGIYHAMNKGMSRASGEYVLVLNSGDCLYSSKTLDEIVPLLSGEDIVYGNSLDVNYLDGSNDLIRKYPGELSFLFFYSSALRHQATFIKKSLYKKIGSFDESFKIVSDWILMIRAFTEFDATSKHIDMTVCRYDRQGVSSLNIELNNLEREKFLRSNFSFFVDDYERFKEFPIVKHRAPGPRLVIKLKEIIKFILPYGMVRLIQKMRK